MLWMQDNGVIKLVIEGYLGGECMTVTADKCTAVFNQYERQDENATKLMLQNDSYVLVNTSDYLF